MLRRRVRRRTGDGDGARDRDDVDDVGRRGRLERRAGTRAGTRRRRGSSSASPPRSAPGRRRGSRRRRGNAGVVDEQVDARVPLEDRAPRRARRPRGRRRRTSRTRRRAPRRAGAAAPRGARAARSASRAAQRARDRRPDAARAAGDDRYPVRYARTRPARSAASCAPSATATSVCGRLRLRRAPRARVRAHRAAVHRRDRRLPSSRSARPRPAGSSSRRRRAPAAFAHARARGRDEPVDGGPPRRGHGRAASAVFGRIVRPDRVDVLRLLVVGGDDRELDRLRRRASAPRAGSGKTASPVPGS